MRDEVEQQVPEPGMAIGGSTTAGPVPQRIGDAERDAAVARLRTALAEGRLTGDEFDERMGAALQARTNADLAPLFVDLPPESTDAPGVGTTAMSAYVVQPMTSSAGGSHEVSAGARGWWLFYSVLWPLFVMLSAVTHQWAFLAIPALLGPVVFGGSRRQNARSARRELHDEYRERRRELRGR